MMTTGYDCQDLLNIGLFRPIFSPTDFIQIKGRGTRTYTFKFVDRSSAVPMEHRIEKQRFKLFDFFGNCEFFEEKFDYDETLKLPTHSKKGSGTYTPPAETDEFENFDPDPLKSIVETPIGNDGMRIDRMYFNKFEETVKEDPVAREYYEQGNFATTIHHIDDHIMNRPKVASFF